MTEMQDLKQEAVKQKQLQQLDSVENYLDEISVRIIETIKWTLRGDVLQGITFMGYFTISLSLVFGSPVRKII